ncbi:HAMP domain-containing protein [Micromonospora terminaliae]|uniref:histidine kinase n=1 Tax=Micromonospora terminaliae TaxID=1914461 RepID=A0AAJ3DI68_9ACTN|nr:HAMP domain-containing sensor histidine kinase [Micromonospora terminaliae]NES27424.1 HAMP domain-containing histidine kinase [Micromonospora terminaliae]QGL47835.1 HAMP domain-containing protein [Micromonospora terminaliae]
MAAGRVVPGRLRRRLVVAFVLVAGMSAGALAAGSYLMLRQARFDGSLQRADADARYQLVVAAQFLPLTDTRRADLLASFEESGRHVVLVAGETEASNPRYAPTPDPDLRAAVAAGQLGFQRTAGRPHLLVVGGRIPGSTAELYVVTVEDDLVDALDQLRTASIVGWAVVVLLAAGVGNALARRTLEPVGRASRAARAVAEGLLHTRLPVRGRDEFSAWATSFNEMAEALENQIEALSRAQARERRFTADVAHELRTPVTALVAAASLLADQLDALPADARRAAELLVADVVRLRRLVEELMEISRLDAGREVLATRPVDVGALLRRIVAGHPDSRARVDGDAPPVVTDPRRLERILSNLVANGIEHGGGDLRAEIRHTGAELVVSVADRGPGIPAEHLAHIFDRFYKADPARTGPGSGLGLAIARENARLLGGRLDVASEVGHGTRFRLTLPLDTGDTSCDA